jgi:hypothetical protein
VCRKKRVEENKKMKVHIDGVGIRSNDPLFDIEETTEEFLSTVRRGLFRLKHEEGDARLKISLDVNVEYEKPVEVQK